MSMKFTNSCHSCLAVWLFAWAVAGASFHDRSGAQDVPPGRIESTSAADPPQGRPGRRNAGELKALRQEVHQLRDDVRRLGDLVEKRLAATNQIANPNVANSKGVERRAIEQALLKEVEFDFKDKRLKDVIRDISRAIDVNVIVDPRIVEEGVDLDTFINFKMSRVTARLALQLMLEPINLRYIFEDEVIKIVTRQRAKGEMAVVSYSVADLVTSESAASGNHSDTQVESRLKQLADVVSSTIASDSWDTVGGPAIRGFTASQSLVIRQTQDVHSEIVELLGRLREQKKAISGPQTKPVVPSVPKTNDPSAKAVPADFQIEPNTLSFFTAKWCGPCQQMSPVVRKLVREGYSIQEVDIDLHQAIARQFKIQSIPCFVRMKDGREVERVEGLISERKLRDFANELLEGKVEAALDRRVSLDFDDASLKDVLNKIQQTTHLNYDVAPLSLQRLKTAPPVTIHVEGIKASSALKLLMNQQNLRYEIRNGMIAIVSPNAPQNNDPQDAERFIRIYSVADLVIPIPDGTGTAPKAGAAQWFNLIDRITSTIEPKKWDAKGPYSIVTQEATMALVIRAPAKVHDSIANLLDGMRKVVDLQICHEILLVPLATDTLLKKAGIKERFDERTKAIRITEEERKQLLAAIQSRRKNGEQMFFPKITTFNGQFGCLNADGLNLPPSQLHFRGFVSEDHTSIRISVALNPKDVLNELTSNSHILPDGGHLLLDVTDQIADPPIDREPKSDNPSPPAEVKAMAPSLSGKSGRTLLLVRPRIIIQAEEEMPRVPAAGDKTPTPSQLP